MNLSNILKRAATGTVVWLLKERIERSLQLARIQAAHKILTAAEQARLSFRFLCSVIIMLIMIGAGMVMIISGASLLISSKLVYSASPETFSFFLWIPFGLILGGIIATLPPFIYLFFVLLSEKTWLDMVKSNRLVGEFISEVLQEAEKKTK